MGAPGGYHVTPGLYRVPDLLTEEQFVAYMKSTYNRTVEFTDTENSVNPNRALGRTVPMGVLSETDDDSTPDHPDPVLKRINEMFPNPPVEEEKSAKTTSKSTK